MIGQSQIKRPVTAFRWLRAQWEAYRRRRPLGHVHFGHLRRTTPISRHFGFDRGVPIDRYYIENFLRQHAHDIRGHVLEVGDATYTRQFGRDSVTRSDVLHVLEGSPAATLVADLTCADHIPSDTFDCIILTQTLLCIYNVGEAVKTVFRILKPGGVVLATVPGITQISHEAVEQYGQYWSFTTLSIQRLFEAVFPAGSLQIGAHGNVLAATAFLYGLVIQDLRQSELDFQDPDYEVIITVRAVKPKTIPCG